MTEETGVRSEESGGEAPQPLTVWVFDVPMQSHLKVDAQSARAYVALLRSTHYHVSDLTDACINTPRYGDNQYCLRMFRRPEDFVTGSETFLDCIVYEKPAVDPAAPITVKQIVSDWLRGNGFDGLCSVDCGYDACGCTVDHLAPCGGGCWRGSIMDCQPAFVDSDGMLWSTKAAADEASQALHGADEEPQ